MKSIRLAIAGLGLVGKRHAQAITQLEGVELAAVIDVAPGSAEDANALRAAHFGDLEDCLAAGGLDGIILATPTPQHVEQATACVNFGLPTLIEKPIGVSVEEASRLVEHAAKKDVPLVVGHHRRHNPLIAKARELVDSGVLGDIRAVHAQCWFHKPDDYFAEAPWRTQKGAGPISVNLVHDVDLLRYLVGEITSVHAEALPSRRGGENEELAGALLRFANGAVGTLSVADGIASPWSWEHTSGEYPIYPVTQESCYRLGGTEGSLSVPDLKLWKHEGGNSWWNPISATQHPRGSADPLVAQMAQFAAVIRGDEKPLVSGAEGLATFAVIEAIQWSADTGERVVL
ncbi:Gfo/Idh/MocA family protein [Ahrensia sp. R2A130]|uniref:Gfo/Idh/MocA family protein n=1 Tax=Ahrensia sp. R2A130 TaxID=744979 RepID=UPI00058FF758|nr:Gfo/Idh/MocA family oxidoreductase [Ahrensia sp. R2A130]